MPPTYSDDSDSDDSEDEYLTSTRGDDKKPKSEAEREAIIRRKLLESFYGKKSHKPSGPSSKNASSSSAVPSSSAAPGDDDGSSSSESSEFGDKNDIDSPHFVAYNHTHTLLLTSPTSTLLSTDEQLALDIRHLNSTMQTLVYENYSKFIDATDAVRSIGRSVDASEEGLNNLTRGIERIETIASEIDGALDVKRSLVAEKVKVRRHLSKLDSLLRLPDTLESQIAKGHYRLAVKSHAGCAEVLSKHSSDFTSLARIEEVCGGIMLEMGRDLKRKLEVWSGEEEATIMSKVMQDTEPIVEPPENVEDIFECAGTLVLLREDYLGEDGGAMDEERVKSLALMACNKYLEGVLDEFKHDMDDDEDEEFKNEEFKNLKTEESMEESKELIPKAYLQGILKTATLYTVTFPSNGSLPSDSINDFVAESFNNFLVHIRLALLSLSLSTSHDDSFATMSAALTNLVLSVREMASGLALPEVGVDMSIASGLVDQTVEVTESMVQRYVALQFYDLRDKSVKMGVAPFIKLLLEGDQTAAGVGVDHVVTVVDVVRMASVALDDIMQLLDGVINKVRAMLANAPVESGMVKLALNKNAKHLGLWLAKMLEVLVGGREEQDDVLLLEVEDQEEGLEDMEDDDDAPKRNRKSIRPMNDDDDTHYSANNITQSNSQDDISALEEAMQALSGAPDETKQYATLAIAELCRIAEKTVVETINISLSSTSKSTKRTSGYKSIVTSNVDNDGHIAEMFGQASRSILALYANDRGYQAADRLCASLSQTATLSQQPSKPTDAIVDVLCIAKRTCENVASVIGGDAKSGPTPDFDNFSSTTARLLHQSRMGTGISVMKGLQLDVERMFVQKPNVVHFQLEFQRDDVLVSLFLIAIKAAVEQTRHLTFTMYAYRQVQLDVELLRIMMPHYITADKTGALFNMLDDLMGSVLERCAEKTSLPKEPTGAFQTDAEGGKSTVKPLELLRQYFEGQRDIVETFSIMDEVTE